MKYPEYHEYARIYAKYLEGNRSAELLSLVPPGYETAQVIDFCGGGGRLATLARERGHPVIVVDESAAMTQPLRQQERLDPDLLVYNTSILLYLAEEGLAKDRGLVSNRLLLLCQQAINYWLNADTVEYIKQQTKKGDVFIFNTFLHQPARLADMVPKKYTLHQKQYIEFSWLNGNMVEHVQICEGEPPHTTRFRWIPFEEFKAMLESHFAIEVFQKKTTSIFRCIRK